MGSNAGNAITTGNGNVGIGHEVLKVHATGQYNVAIGWKAMDDTNAGGNSANSNNNIAIGGNALGGTWANAVSEFNVAIGTNSMAAALNAATNNTAVGYFSLNAITSGDNNIGIGSEAGISLTSGIKNTIMGVQAGDAMTSTNYTTIIGFQAGTAINSTDANGTVAIGYLAGTAITSGQYNTAIGFEAGKNQVTADSNTFVGYQSGRQTTGNNNTAIGKYTMYEGAGADYNTAIGTNALQNTTSDYNTALGYNALTSVLGGYRNTALGANAGDALTTGLENVIIGYESEASAVDADNQIVIGASTTGLGNNYAVIGNADITRLYVASDGAGVLYANGTIQTSDKRLKENIEDSDLGLEFINKIRPVSYKYINDKQDGKTKYGIIAQEVQEVLKESNNEDFAGIKDSDEYLGADYNQFVAPLIKSVQELTEMVKSQQKEIEELKKK
jgi:hypothetical protein